MVVVVVVVLCDDDGDDDNDDDIGHCDDSDTPSAIPSGNHVITGVASTSNSYTAGLRRKSRMMLLFTCSRIDGGDDDR